MAFCYRPPSNWEFGLCLEPKLEKRTCMDGLPKSELANVDGLKDVTPVKLDSFDEFDPLGSVQVSF